MPTDRTKQLVYELDAWYRGHKLRQKDLAAELGLTAQALSEILSLRNRPSSEATLRIVEFLETETMKPHFDDPPGTIDPEEPKTLHQAKEMLSALRAELKSKPTAITAPPLGPWDVVVPEDPVMPATPPPAIPPPATSPTTSVRAKSGFANLSTPDLLANLKAARAVGNNADNVRRLLAEVEARGIMDCSYSTQSPAKPTLRFPTSATTPAAVQAVFDNASMSDLRQMLQTEKDTNLKTVIFKEIKRREQSLR
jgi:transcriptional regulator with XRE-family HTH domain